MLHGAFIFPFHILTNQKSFNISTISVWKLVHSRNIITDDLKKSRVKMKILLVAETLVGFFMRRRSAPIRKILQKILLV